MANITDLVTSGITSIFRQDITIDDLAPNNYLTIIWKDAKSDKVYNTMDIVQEEAIEYTNAINSSIERAINNNNISYVGQNRFINIESIAKYIAQNKIKDSVRRRIANALIGLASGDPNKLTDNSINLLINVFGEIADKTARELGYTDPYQIFSQITGQNVINVFKTLGSKTKDFIDDFTNKINNSSKTSLSSIINKNETKGYIGFILGLTTSDTESYEITIPRKKVEDGSNYVTHFINQPFKKDFTVKLTNKVISANYNRIEEINNIETIKDKLIEISQSHTLFDIYIRLSNEKVYKRENVFFTSLSFTKDEDSGNGYTCTFSLSPISSFKSKVFISDKMYGSGKDNNKIKSRQQGKKSISGGSFVVGWNEEQLKPVGLKNLNNAKVWARANGYDIIYSKNITPNYKFTTKAILTNDGYYALSDDLETLKYGDKKQDGKKVGDLKKDLYVTKVGNQTYINNGKIQYTIINVTSGVPYLQKGMNYI